MRKQIATWRELFARHELLTRASAIAFDALVAAVAFSLLALAVLGELGRQDLWYQYVAPHIRSHVLPGVYTGVDQTVSRIFSADSGGLITLASLMVLWKVSSVVRCCMGAFTQIYEVPERRPTWIRTPLSYALAAALSAAILTAILVVTALGGVVHGVWYALFAVVRWATAIGLVGLAFGLLVHYGPAKPREKRWASVGAGLVVVSWVVESIVFAWYISTLANFKTAVGSLAVLIVVCTYFYVGSIILLVGIELDELVRKEAKQTKRRIRSAAAAV
jgi:membrane protein